MHGFSSNPALTYFLSLLCTMQLGFASDNEDENDAESKPVFRFDNCNDENANRGNLVNCFEIYSVPPKGDVKIYSIDDIEDVIRSFSYKDEFGVCLDDGVPTQVLVDIVDLVKNEKIVYSLPTVKFPCI